MGDNSLKICENLDDTSENNLNCFALPFFIIQNKTKSLMRTIESKNSDKNSHKFLNTPMSLRKKCLESGVCAQASAEHVQKYHNDSVKTNQDILTESNPWTNVEKVEK